MRIKKKDSDFNSYSIEDLSYGELVALERALAGKHDDPITDEIYATIKWYLDELPKPGESDSEDTDENDGDGNSGSSDVEFDTTPPKEDKGGSESDTVRDEADDYLEAPPETEEGDGEPSSPSKPSKPPQDGDDATPDDDLI